MSAFAARTVLRATQRRQFSILNAMRQMGRTMETHPFQRLSGNGSQRPDYVKMISARLVTAGMFFPTAAVILGWPWATAWALGGDAQ